MADLYALEHQGVHWHYALPGHVRTVTNASGGRGGDGMICRTRSLSQSLSWLQFDYNCPHWHSNYHRWIVILSDHSCGAFHCSQLYRHPSSNSSSQTAMPLPLASNSSLVHPTAHYSALGHSSQQQQHPSIHPATLCLAHHTQEPMRWRLDVSVRHS